MGTIFSGFHFTYCCLVSFTVVYLLIFLYWTVRKGDLENGISATEKAKFGTAHFLIELENKRSIKVGDSL